MTTGIKQKVTKDQWDNELDKVLDILDSTINVQFELTNGRPLCIVVEHWKDRRSDAQNRFMWPILRAIGKAAGEPDEERVKRHMLTEWAGERFTEVMGKRQQIYPRTSKFTTKQMVNFIEFCMATAANEYGVTPPMPPDWEQYARGAK